MFITSGIENHYLEVSSLEANEKEYTLTEKNSFYRNFDILPFEIFWN